MVLVGYWSDEIAGLVEAFHRQFEGVELLLGGFEFGEESLLHARDNITQYIKRFRQFLPALSDGASLEVSM